MVEYKALAERFQVLAMSRRSCLPGIFRRPSTLRPSTGSLRQAQGGQGKQAPFGKLPSASSLRQAPFGKLRASRVSRVGRTKEGDRKAGRAGQRRICTDQLDLFLLCNFHFCILLQILFHPEFYDPRDQREGYRLVNGKLNRAFGSLVC